GVISYSVTRKTPEIGIRMALGATVGQVRSLVLASTLRLASVGMLLGALLSLALSMLLGALLSLALSQALGSLLFATSPRDASAYMGMALALLLVALVAGYIPARRASRIEPMRALRAE